MRIIHEVEVETDEDEYEYEQSAEELAVTNAANALESLSMEIEAFLDIIEDEGSSLLRLPKPLMSTDICEIIQQFRNYKFISTLKHLNRLCIRAGKELN